MASHDTGRPLPKFGEWDVNNPASAEGFTVIFSKARDQKMTNGPSGSSNTSSSKPQNNFNDAPKQQQQQQQQQQQHCGYENQCFRCKNNERQRLSPW